MFTWILLYLFPSSWMLSFCCCCALVLDLWSCPRRLVDVHASCVPVLVLSPLLSSPSPSLSSRRHYSLLVYSTLFSPRIKYLLLAYLIHHFWRFVIGSLCDTSYLILISFLFFSYIRTYCTYSPTHPPTHSFFHSFIPLNRTTHLLTYIPHLDTPSLLHQHTHTHTHTHMYAPSTLKKGDYYCTYVLLYFFYTFYSQMLYSQCVFTRFVHSFFLCCVVLDWIGLDWGSAHCVWFVFPVFPFPRFAIFAILLSFLPVPSLARSRFVLFFWIGYRL